MSALTTVVDLAPPRAAAAPAEAELHAFRHPGECARAVLAGSAGSGKSTLLRRLADLLARDGVASLPLRESTRVSQVPQDVVLLVDDAHLLADARLDELCRRADDPDAGLVVALRSWPSRPGLLALTTRLERSRPALLLGEVSRAQLLDDVDLGECADGLLRLTGGVAWLVHESRTAHDERDCAGDAAHRTLQDALRPRILHRLMSVSPDVRRLVDELSFGLATTAAGDDLDALIAEGYAEGLLKNDGRPAPAIAAAIRAMTPVSRVVDVISTGSAATLHDGSFTTLLEGVRDPRAALVLAERAQSEVDANPRLAAGLLEQAVACGADPRELSVDRARAAWALGRLDEAGALLDAARGDGDAPPDLTDLSAAVWAERAMMSLADDTYRAGETPDPATGTRALIAAVAAGRAPGEPEPGASDPGASGPLTAPSTAGIAYHLLGRGLAATLLAPDGPAGVADLQRGSELFSAAADHTPAVELPAAIAAAAAIGTGDLKAAQSGIEAALRAGQGGPYRQPRLHLWAGWIALQRERPADARAALAAAVSARALSPRDDAFAAAIEVGLARRYDDAAGLAAAWESARPRIVLTEPDLFGLLPWGELIISAARLGEVAWTQNALDQALMLVAGLGDPPVWATPLHWAGIQRGILLNQPDSLAPHARALVAAAPHNRLAARMAHAGRVWTAVLSGAVDPDAVERAARGLATVGLAWDGARLAGHGAGRSEDRRVVARLLACARELHPRETARAPEARADAEAATGAGDDLLSEREREVAELVLQGKTYVEIGAAIFISPRTAEHHIAHIRRRLSATSRSDLLSKLRLALEGAAQPAGAEHSGARG